MSVWLRALISVGCILHVMFPSAHGLQRKSRMALAYVTLFSLTVTQSVWTSRSVHGIPSETDWILNWSKLFLLLLKTHVQTRIPMQPVLSGLNPGRRLKVCNHSILIQLLCFWTLSIVLDISSIWTPIIAAVDYVWKLWFSGTIQRICLFSDDFSSDSTLILTTITMKQCTDICARPHVCKFF
jgi:hypothetical protein